MKKFFMPISCLIIFGAVCGVLAYSKASLPSIPLAENPESSETRCGWFSNPTPSNAWLNDRDGEWIISIQGGYQAEGDWPDFKPSQWVETNVHYGYGCACMKVTTDDKEKHILKILSATAKPLSTCKKDKALMKKRPK